MATTPFDAINATLRSDPVIQQILAGGGDARSRGLAIADRMQQLGLTIPQGAMVNSQTGQVQSLTPSGIPPGQFTDPTSGRGGTGPQFQMPGGGGERPTLGPGGIHIPNLPQPTPFPNPLPGSTPGSLNPPPSGLPPTDTRNTNTNSGQSVWDRIRSILSGNTGNLIQTIGSIAAAAAQGRTAGRAAEAENARADDRLALQRDTLRLNAPGVRASQAALGDIMANTQDLHLNVPGIRPSNIEGGLRPSNLGPNARGAGTELSRQALEHLMSGDDISPATPYDQPSGIDSFLNYLGLIGTGVGAFRNPNAGRPQPVPNPTTPATPPATSPITRPQDPVNPNSLAEVAKRSLRPRL